MTEIFVKSIKRGLKTSFIGRNIFYYPSIDSTNDVAKELAERGEPEGTLVISDYQTAGKGRLGRRWLSPPKSSILISLLFRPDFPPKEAQRLTMICSLAVVDAIKAVTGLAASIKWPNDIIVGGKKAGGILTEIGTKGEKLDYVIVGIGINVNVDFSKELLELAETATSLSQELGREVSRLEILWEMLNGIEERYERLLRGEPIHDEWASRLITLHKWVKVTTSQGELHGWAEGVDPDGALIIRTPNGISKRLLAGDVTLKEGGYCHAKGF
jgi:BirA family biotin operon repressor/biotin-[acetyl-CoA-carboxylase] ligase